MLARVEERQTVGQRGRLGLERLRGRQRDPHEAARAEALRGLRQRVEVAPREQRAAGIAHGRDARALGRERLEEADRRALERGRHVGELEAEAQVGFVAAVAADRLGVRDAADRARDLVRRARRARRARCSPP